MSHWAWFMAYVGASVVRGLVVGAGVLLVTLWFAPLHAAAPLWILVFVIAAIIAGLLAAILPARRAARLNVLEALQYE